jgi:outer membrane protein assembly factor BamB
MLKTWFDRNNFNLKYCFIAWLGLALLLGACSDSPVNTATPSGATTAAAAASTTTPAATPASGSAKPANATTTSAAATPGANPATNTAAQAATLTPAAPVLPLDANKIPIISPLQANSKPFTQNWRAALDIVGEAIIAGEADGMVFVKNRQGGLFALDATSGAVAWKIPAPPLAGALPLFPPLAVVGPGTVALGDLAAEKITGYDTKTGQKKWDFDLRFNAPNRDTGSRFVGGKIYDNTLAVAVSSKQNPFDEQHQTTNPEYLSLTGIDLKTGKAVWAALTDPPSASGFGVRLGGAIFGSKNIYVESPDLSVGAIEGATGARLWQVLNMLVLHGDNPDLLYSVVPEAGADHQPILRKNDSQTGQVIWEKQLPVQTVDDPPVAISPDEKTVYVSVVVSQTESYLYGVDLTKNTGLWRFSTKIFGDYTLTATNEGVRLRSYGKQAGIALFPRDTPLPARWAIGNIELGEEVNTPEGLYLTARDSRYPGLLYLVNPNRGEVLYTAKTEAISGEPLPGENQTYLAATDEAGKPVIYAFARPKT